MWKGTQVLGQPLVILLKSRKVISLSNSHAGFPQRFFMNIVVDIFS